MKLNASVLYFAHFGVTDRVQENLRLAVDKLKVWYDILVNAVKENRFNGVAERMIAQACAELEPVRKTESLYKFLAEVIVPMNAAGYIKYYQEKLEAGLNKKGER